MGGKMSENSIGRSQRSLILSLIPPCLMQNENITL